MAQAKPARGRGGRRLLLLVSDDEPESKQHGAPEPDRTGHEQDDPAPFNSLSLSADADADGGRDRNRDAEWKNDQRPPLVPARPVTSMRGVVTIRTRTRPEPRAPRRPPPGRRLTLATTVVVQTVQGEGVDRGSGLAVRLVPETHATDSTRAAACCSVTAKSRPASSPSRAGSAFSGLFAPLGSSYAQSAELSPSPQGGSGVRLKSKKGRSGR